MLALARASWHVRATSNCGTPACFADARSGEIKRATAIGPTAILCMWLSLPSLFIIIRDKPVEHPDPETRTPALIDFGSGGTHPRASDVDMGPGRIVHKPLEELRRCDRPRMPAAGVRHVGHFRLDHFVVGKPKR